VEKTAHRKIFRDVVRGYSDSVLNGRVVYIKHLTPHDQVDLEEIEQRYFNKAKARGVPTEEEMLKILEEDNQWTVDDEKFINKKKIFLASLRKGLTKLILQHQIDHQTTLLEKESKIVKDKELEKYSLLGNTCERYAKDRLNDFYMIASFFKDEDIKQPLYSSKEFEEVGVEELRTMVEVYNEMFQFFTEESIQHTVLDDFFSPYLGFAEDSMQFYGIPFCQLTYNQVRMIVYAKVFKSIFDHNDNIPEQILKDPKKLLDYGSVSKEERENLKEKISHGDGSTIVGATHEDYKALGITDSDKGISLHEEAKKKGGTLNMEDLMKLHGVS
jgi:hypothetical protein